MALNRSNKYPGRFLAPTTARPQGAFKNRTSPTAQDGSYLEADWANDWDGFFARILNVAGVTPNGNVDSGTSSQLYDALLSAMPGRLLNVQRFLNNGNYIPTAGTRLIIVEVQAAGGAGGGTPATSSSQNSVASGGSSGQYMKSMYLLSSISTPVSLSVGTGGTGIAGSSGNGGNGTSFGSLMIAQGGFGGGAGTAASAAYVIQPGIIRSLPTAGNIDNSGGSPGGAGIFTQLGAGVSGNGGSSRFAGGGNPGSVSGGGFTQAVGYGSGGAGAAVAASTAAQPGGAGGNGIIIVWEYA